MNRWILLIAGLVIVLGLAGCADEGDPAQTALDYLQARVDGDEDALRGLICAAQESQLPMLASSFAAVDASLQDVTCERSGTEGEFTRVMCDGLIVLDYGQEQQEIEIKPYLMIQEDGEWKWCGEG